jgi:hypothetical protein
MFRLVYPRSWDPVRLHDYFNLVVIAVLNMQNLAYLATGAGFQLFFTSAMVSASVEGPGSSTSALLAACAGCTHS